VVDVGVEVEGLKNMNFRRFTMKKLFKTAQRGAINMEAILVTVVLAAIAFVVLDVMFAGPMTTSNASVQALTGTDSGTTTGKTMMGLLYWLIPLGLGIALLITVLKSRK
jgi:glucan phosphoethanolaminetransferase (alkaline phosphatase superfamily)